MRGERIKLPEIIVLFSSLLHFAIGLIVLCMNGIGGEYRRVPFLVSLLLLGMAVAFWLIFSTIFVRKQVDGPADKKRHAAEYIMTIGLFLAQVFVCYNTYFFTGWDCSILLSASENLAKGWDISGSATYFSTYPNNLLLTHIFGFIKHCVKAMGVTEKSHGMVALIFFQCALNSLTGLILFRVLCRLRGRKIAWMGYVFYLILVGTSPWMLIPYSDSMALFLPILLFYLWLLKLDACPAIKVLWWVASGFLGAVCYHLKPQTVIMFIAIYLLEFLSILKRQESGERIRRMTGCAMGLFCFVLFFQGIEQRYYDRYDWFDRERTLGVTHFLMMGLNWETKGGYSIDDADFSASITTSAERKKMNLQIAGQRLSEMGAGGLARHLIQKTNNSYGSGTFGWPVVEEEYFFRNIPEEKIPYISAALRSILYGHSLGNTVLETIKQCTWLTVLFLVAAGFFPFRRDERYAACSLALIGFFLYSCLFEVAGRYLFTYAPVYCVLAAVSLEEIRCRLGIKQKESQESGAPVEQRHYLS